jgi:hypothetical protein
MAGRHNLPDQRRLPLDLLAAEKEGGVSVRPLKSLEHRRRPLRMGAVIEGERRPDRIVDAPR